jgi:hypothetical protein
MNAKMTSNQNDPLVPLIVIYILAILAITFLSCNPVKQVLKDKKKLDQVAAVVVASGYCANDTTVIVKSDTLTQYDTITNTEIETFVKNDTIYRVNVKREFVTKTVKIRDTVRQVVVDHARLGLMEKEKMKLVDELADEKEGNRLKLNLIIVLILFILGYAYFKTRP